jgi:DNA polymerase-3 subunit delta'
MNHIRQLSERLTASAREGNLSQSLLLVGRPGVGKFSVALDIARFMLCEMDGSGCGKCRSCKDVEKLVHPDHLLLFPFPNIRPESKKLTVFSYSDHALSPARYSEDTRDEIERFKETKLEDPYAIVDFNKKENIPVDAVKDLIRALSKKPLRGGRRVVVILDIDKMAFGAADLFLKAVEEPPLNTHLVLTTSRPDLLLPTLLSRTHVIKVPPASREDLEPYLVRRLGLKTPEAQYLARMSGGSPGRAVYLCESETSARRHRILSFFAGLDGDDGINRLIDDVNSEYPMRGIGYEELKIDFEIMESIIHDLCLLGENGLDKHLINVDIKKELQALGRRDLETLDLWKACCAETKRACLVNNVAASTAMTFFYISCARAAKNPAGLNFKLP